ncbi:MAG: hypothetical protein U1F15_01915 [Burkholderiales bacterium]
MSCRVESAADFAYRYCTDALPRTADRVRAVLRARAVDEITREPIRVDMQVTTAQDGVVPRVARDGLVGLIGQPARLFPALGVAGVPLAMRVRAAGFLPLDLAGTLGPVAGFPDSFAPLDLGDAPLHRVGVALAGRVVERATVAPPAVPAATIAIDGLWSTLPPANWTPPALLEPPNIVALEPGLYAPRVATATIRQRGLVLLPALAKRLQLAAGPGELRVRLSDRDGLVAGTVIVVDSAEPALREAIAIAQVDTGAGVDEAAWVRLAHPLAYLHRDGATVVPVVVQPPVAPTTMARDGIAGDRVAFTAAAPAFAAGSFVEIDDGAAPREFQRVSLYATTSDGNGFFRLPPIARVALVRLNVQHAGLTPALPILTLDYRGAQQRVTVSME